MLREMCIRDSLNNVRNFQWRSETDYTPQWESRTYDLDRLRSADLVLSYWMGPHIAHTPVSYTHLSPRRLDRKSLAFTRTDDPDQISHLLSLIHI